MEEVTKTVLTKHEEKRLLTQLWEGEGYFADEFSESDLQVMISNIDSDHPILMGTQVDEDLAGAKKKNVEDAQRIGALEAELEQERKAALEGEVELAEARSEIEALKSKVAALEYDWTEASKNMKVLKADYEQLAEDYEKKSDLLDVAVAAIGRITTKL